MNKIIQIKIVKLNVKLKAKFYQGKQIDYYQINILKLSLIKQK